MAPLLWLGAALAAGYGGYKAFFEEKPKNLGDMAKVGDGVQAGSDIFESFNPGMTGLPADIKALKVNAPFIFLQVERVDDKNVYGPLRGTSAVSFPREIRPKDAGIPSTQWVLPRQSITAIFRDGKVATAQSAGFHGEARLPRVFQG